MSNAKKDEDGGWDFDLSLQENEVSFFVQYAVNSLLEKGLITITETEEEQEVSILERLDIEGMHQT